MLFAGCFGCSPADNSSENDFQTQSSSTDRASDFQESDNDSSGDSSSAEENGGNSSSNGVDLPVIPIS